MYQSCQICEPRSIRIRTLRYRFSIYRLLISVKMNFISNIDIVWKKNEYRKALIKMSDIFYPTISLTTIISERTLLPKIASLSNPPFFSLSFAAPIQIEIVFEDLKQLKTLKFPKLHYLNQRSFYSKPKIGNFRVPQRNKMKRIHFHFS